MGRCRVDKPVGERPHCKPPGTELGDDVDEVGQVPAEAVQAPDDQRVPRAQVGQAGVPLRSVGPGAGGLVGVDLLAPFGPALGRRLRSLGRPTVMLENPRPG